MIRAKMVFLPWSSRVSCLVVANAATSGGEFLHGVRHVGELPAQAGDLLDQDFLDLAVLCQVDELFRGVSAPYPPGGGFLQGVV